jgi:hypothetical protein
MLEPKSKCPAQSARRPVHILGIALSLISTLLILPSNAQQYGAHKGVVASPAINYKPTTYTLLKAPVDLPDLPKYTQRAYFLCGFDYPPDSVVPARRVQLKFAMHEAPDRVLDWYRDALISYSWNIIPTKSSETVTARKGGNSCCVIVHKSQGPWFSSVVLINYRLGA